MESLVLIASLMVAGLTLAWHIRKRHGTGRRMVLGALIGLGFGAPAALGMDFLGVYDQSLPMGGVYVGSTIWLPIALAAVGAACGIVVRPRGRPRQP